MLDIYPKWDGMPIIPSKAAMNELYKLGLTLEDVKEILEHGYEYKKRKKGMLEKCIKRKNIVVKVVVAKSYNYSFRSDCWVIVHIGIIRW